MDWPKKMDDHRFQKLQLALTKNTQTIIWISEKPLDQAPEYLVELDYFFDRLLSELILQGQVSKEKHFVMGTQFGRPLYLLQANGEHANRHIESMISLLPNESSREVLFLGPGKKPHLPKDFIIKLP